MPFDVTGVTIEEEMQRSYLDYAMSVIVARALPDVRDGLKPVHRRILYAMKESGYDWNRTYRKSARIVGDVMGQYHPHGDSAIYDAMVRMAQLFSLRVPLIDGQGNFGSMDGDPPAAMRYTEARLARVASEALLEDYDRDTVDFRANYDETTREPVVLPAAFPNLLVNGAGGIAVGMATNIPPHNLGEVIDACCAYLDNPEVSIDELMQHVPGPDFPTGGIILGRAGARDAYHTGRGGLRIRAKTSIEEVRKDRHAIIVSEIPFQVNKSRMLERIAELVRDKTVEGISDLRDESDRTGVRVVIEIKRDAEPEVVLNQLYRFSNLQTSFGVNMLAINAGRPELMDLKQVLTAFVAFREEVISRRTAFELGKARERAHLLVGLAIAVANIDVVIELIRRAKDPAEAKAALIGRGWRAGDVQPLVELIDEPGRAVGADGAYHLSDAQAKAILELRLQRLTGLERDKIAEELQALAAKIVEYLEILESRTRLYEVMREELMSMKARFATTRRTTFEDADLADIDDEDLIQREEMVVTISHTGYVKRVPLSTYRAQRRGGKGRSGMATREEDFVSRVFVCSTHTPVLFFSSTGKVYKLKVYRLPVGSPQSRGKALVNMLPLDEGETITTSMAMPEDESAWDETYLVFATSKGGIRRNKLSDFVRVPSNGKIAMKLTPEEDGHLVSVNTLAEDQDVLLVTRNGRCIRFNAEDVRVFSGRTSTGVRGINLGEDDEVISMSILGQVAFEITERDAYLRQAAALRRGEAEVEAEAEGDADEGEGDEAFVLSEDRAAELRVGEEFILTVANDGFGKRTSAYEYRVTRRGGQGITTISLDRPADREAEVIAAFPVEEADQIMLVTDAGQLIRIPVHDIRIVGRSTRGVTLFKVAEDEKIVSVARLAEDEGADEGDGEESDGQDGIVETNQEDASAPLDARAPASAPENGPDNTQDDVDDVGGTDDSES